MLEKDIQSYHEYIDEHSVIDRFLMNKLSGEELERFECHYISCTECIDRLELTETFEKGMKDAYPRVVEEPNHGFLYRLKRFWRKAFEPRFVPATVGLFVLMIGLPVILFNNQTGGGLEQFLGTPTADQPIVSLVSLRGGQPTGTTDGAIQNVVVFPKGEDYGLAEMKLHGSDYDHFKLTVRKGKKVIDRLDGQLSGEQVLLVKLNRKRYEPSERYIVELEASRGEESFAKIGIYGLSFRFD